MPVLGGLEAAQAIRERDAEIPILALTADTAAEDVERCREAGMDGHLAKPVSLPALREELDRRIAPVLDDALLDELAESLGGRALVDQMLEVYRGEPGRAARAPARRRRPRGAARGRARAALAERRLRGSPRARRAAPARVRASTAARAGRDDRGWAPRASAAAGRTADRDALAATA